MINESRVTGVILENGKKIEASLKAKKSTFMETQFAAACGSFGPDIGERVLNLVWNAYGTLEHMTEEKLQSLEGFGKSRIEQYLEYEHIWYMTKIHMQLHSYGIEFINPKNQIESVEKLKTLSNTFSPISSLSNSFVTISLGSLLLKTIS